MDWPPTPCGSGVPAANITATDDSGTPVTLPAPARRIITLSPHATELVYAAGAGDQLAAVASYSDWPPEAKHKPAIGSFGGLDRERLLTLAPDLVIAWDSGNRAGDLAWLTRMGIPVYRSEPGSLADIARNLRDIGRLAGTETQAEAAASQFLLTVTAPCPVPQQTGLIQLAQSPLITVGRNHWLNDAMRLAGVSNLFADQDRSVFSANPEAVLARRPQLQLSTSPVGQRYAPQVIELDPKYWSRPGPRLAQGIRNLCRRLMKASDEHDQLLPRSSP